MTETYHNNGRLSGRLLRALGCFLAPLFARWRVTRMVRDFERHFGAAPSTPLAA